MFLFLAIGKPVWICADIRHQEDYQWFLDFYSDRIKRVRITANEEVRKARGWKFTESIDTGPSECDLDNITNWDLIIRNNDGDGNEVNAAVNTIMDWIKESNSLNT